MAIKENFCIKILECKTPKKLFREMSLVIRRVKEISKKRNRKSRKWYIVEPFDDAPSKLLIDEEYGEEQDSLPSLNSVYKKTIVGTPILFRRINGWEYQETHGYNVNFQSITFMKEYHNKSFEELRWEDYLSNRKGNHYIHQETNFPRIVTNYNFSISDNYEFFHPLPRNILKHLNLGRISGPYSNEINLTNKNKLQNLFVGKYVDSPYRPNIGNESSKKFPNENNFWHLEQANMSKEKIKSYFSKLDNFFNSYNCNPKSMFFLPCRKSEVSILRKSKNSAMSGCGDCVYQQESGRNLIRKYTEKKCFTKDYLRSELHPYLQHHDLRKLPMFRCKNHLLGAEISSFN